MSDTTHYKVLAAPPEFCTHRGDILQLSAEKAAEYAEKGDYFRPATTEEVQAHNARNETATTAAAPETAMVPGSSPKTAQEATDLLKKGQEAAKK